MIATDGVFQPEHNLNGVDTVRAIACFALRHPRGEIVQSSPPDVAEELQGLRGTSLPAVTLRALAAAFDKLFAQIRGFEQPRKPTGEFRWA